MLTAVNRKISDAVSHGYVIPEDDTDQTPRAYCYKQQNPQYSIGTTSAYIYVSNAWLRRLCGANINLRNSLSIIGPVAV